MVLRRANSQSFHKILYGGQTETCTLLKRNNDQQEGTVTAFVLFEVRRGSETKSGEPIQNDMPVTHTCTWLVPNVQLRRLGINYINVLDRIVDKYNQWWQPEAGQDIILSQFDNYSIISCVRVDPAPNSVLIGIPQFATLPLN